MIEKNERHRWFDTSINLQTVATGIIGAAVALTVAYFTLVGRVSLAEADIANLKISAHEKQQETENSLNDIKGSVKDTNQKLDNLTAFLLQNSVSTRPDIKRWAR